MTARQLSGRAIYADRFHAILAMWSATGLSGDKLDYARIEVIVYGRSEP